MGPVESAALPLGWLFMSTNCIKSAFKSRLAEFEGLNAFPCLEWGYLTCVSVCVCVVCVRVCVCVCVFGCVCMLLCVHGACVAWWVGGY